jgi:hypothetical protein
VHCARGFRDSGIQSTTIPTQRCSHPSPSPSGSVNSSLVHLPPESNNLDVTFTSVNPFDGCFVYFNIMKLYKLYTMATSRCEFSFRPIGRPDRTNPPQDFSYGGAVWAAACRVRGDSMPPRSKSCAVAAGSSANFSHSVQRPGKAII